MTETAGDQPERKKPPKMAVDVGRKAVGETLRSPEVPTPEQKVINFVDQTAVFEGGQTRDIVKAGVLTNMLAGNGLVLRSRIIDTSPRIDGSRISRSVEVGYPGGCSDSIDIDESNKFSYTFGENGGVFEDLDTEERGATVTAFFIRYNLDYYAQHPELWRPEASNYL